MSAQLNDLMSQYADVFGEDPTIIGLTDPETALAQALTTGEKIPDTPIPDDVSGPAEI